MVEKDPKSKGKTIKKVVFDRTNPSTGVDYFKEVVVTIRNPEDPNIMPTIEELPPEGYTSDQLTKEVPEPVWNWTNH